MTEAEKREAARQFYNKWNGKGKEDEDYQSYWMDILQNIMGVADATDRIILQKKIIGPDGNTKRIDIYIPETRVLIEQKSLGIALDKPQSGHGGMTPYEQAKYYDNYLPYDEKARWIVVSNFAEIWIYDMNAKVPTPEKLLLSNIKDQYPLLNFLINDKVKTITTEMELSLKAGELVGKIHDRFLEQYSDPMAKKTQNSLNILCVRLVFCLYAEDAGLFGGNGDEFSKYIGQYEPKDIRRALIDLFKVLDTPIAERDEYLDDELAAFPYVNGGLFANENIVIPKITEEIKQTIIESSHFDWSKISPTIFGAVFESTLNPETRRAGGMHYTSIENIHKVIDPLFLDDLKAELAEIKKISVVKTREKALRDYQDKLAALKFLDPACGSGNFLTETYVSIRRLENEVIEELNHGQIMLGDKAFTPIKVAISQFYGIEINDFAVTVAKTALWIAESQMMKETEDIVHLNLDFLPLKTNAYIIEGNALQLDWNRVVHKDELSYIMGNPPFVARAGRTKADDSSSKGMIDDSQKEDRLNVFGEDLGNVDYVACWFKKAASFTENTKIRSAFVATDSICQGQQIYPIWNNILKDNITINFAYKFFKWESEASKAATVYVVIVGFSHMDDGNAVLYDGKERRTVPHISPYLIPADDIIVSSTNKPLCQVPVFKMGNQPIDDGNYLFTEDEKNEFVLAEPNSEQYFKKWLDGAGFLNNTYRYCLWLGDCSPSVLRAMPKCMERVKNVYQYRSKSSRQSTKKLANTPTRFQTENMPKGNYIVIPEVSSGNRRYIPIGFLDENTLCSNKLRLMSGATLLHFGVLHSNVHMAWTRTVCGYFGPSYQYSINIVYNNFPWPSPTEEQKTKIEQTAQGILDARALYPDCSLADLYDPLTMPPELRKAHQQNDKAVMAAYGFSVKNMSEADCVAALMKMYQDLTK